MARYKGKNVVVDAYQWVGDYDSKRDPKWITEAMKKTGDTTGAVRMFGTTIMKIVGEKSILNVLPNDYVVRLADGVLIPLSPVIFELLFTEV